MQGRGRTWWTACPPADLAGGVAGLQGEGEGAQNDIQLPDGTVLPQPITTDTLYNVFGNAWRVSQATSLFDYAPGQTTATFTDVNFPSDVVTLANLPAAQVAAAAALAAAAGITNPALAAAAELDYLATGQMQAFSSAANVQQAGLVSGAETVTPVVTPAATAGVAADAATVRAKADGPTAVVFDVYLTQAEATDAAITYRVVDGSGLGAAAFGGTLPTGAVIIAAGQTTAQFTIEVPQGALGALPTANLAVQIATTNGDAVFAPMAQTTLVGDAPLPGDPALPQIAYLGTVGQFSHVGRTYTLTLDSVQDQFVAPLQFAVMNASTGDSDVLTGTFGAPTGSGFTVTGATLGSPLGAGQAYDGLYFTTQTTSLGTSSETIVFHPIDTNGSGYTAALPDLTLVVTDPVLAQAQAQLNTPGTIVFANVRVGTTNAQVVSFTNTAPAPAAGLDVTPLTTGDATASGMITNLAPGANDATSLTVGLNTAAAGARAGTVTLLQHSDAGGGVTRPLADAPTDTLFGTVYRPAAAAPIAPIAAVLHVGDPGTFHLTVANTDPADGYSENLIANLQSAPTGLTVTAGTTSGIAAGRSDSSLTLVADTSAAAIIVGPATVALSTDGGTGPDSIDGLGRIAVGTVQAAVQITVDILASASLGVSGMGRPRPFGTACSIWAGYGRARPPSASC